MSEKYWWNIYGPFKPWRECPTRPDPGDVLLFYPEKRGIQSDEQVAYLIGQLYMQKSIVYIILKGEGLDSIPQCRILVQDLKIYPPLLGIDANIQSSVMHTGGRIRAFPSVQMRGLSADKQSYRLSEVTAGTKRCG